MNSVSDNEGKLSRDAARADLRGDYSKLGASRYGKENASG
ncbi:hypothetical protein NSU_1284 [Novosphingobium pentaromativorans US6-1]|uniref:Uncharacterized protein n=1 Tax=Novosphingobium pentaromativorans US6-1 TaxID=1088721 RepID=G6EAB3_9SPHN|nr:hypothetical protein NSU_1284 [Novosphingobium pentaromativorans US6-1]